MTLSIEAQVIKDIYLLTGGSSPFGGSLQDAFDQTWLNLKAYGEAPTEVSTFTVTSAAHVCSISSVSSSDGSIEYGTVSGIPYVKLRKAGLWPTTVAATVSDGAPWSIDSSNLPPFVGAMPEPWASGWQDLVGGSSPGSGSITLQTTDGPPNDALGHPNTAGVWGFAPFAISDNITLSITLQCDTPSTFLKPYPDDWGYPNDRDQKALDFLRHCFDTYSTWGPSSQSPL